MSSNTNSRRSGIHKKKTKVSENVTTSSKKPPNSPDDSGRASPDSSCAICLGRHENKSFTNNCLHEFCFRCLLEWSKVKAECPLCKQPFSSIIHNVRSNQEYDEHKIPIMEPTEPDLSSIDLVHQRFRYRTTGTNRAERTAFALQRLDYLRQFAVDVGVLPRQSERRPARSRFTGTSVFRRQTYQRDQWVRPLADITGRYRETTPEFFQLNPAMTQRLVPWLNRELNVLLVSHENRLSYVMELILRLITQHHIRSRHFREAIQDHIGAYTEHFIHEFFQFARSPYDMYGFDENATYEPRNTLQHEEVAVSESSDEDVPGTRPANSALGHRVAPRDIPMPPSPQPGPSGIGRGSATLLVDDGQSYGVASAPSSSSRRPSDEDEDDDDADVEIVQVVQPPTPEVITLSDSENEDEERELERTTSSTSRGKALKRTRNSRSPTKKSSPPAKEQRSKSSKKKKRKRNRSPESDDTPSSNRVRPRDREDYYVRQTISSSSSSRRYWDMDPEDIQRSLHHTKRNSSDDGVSGSVGDHNRRWHKRGRKNE